MGFSDRLLQCRINDDSHALSGAGDLFALPLRVQRESRIGPARTSTRIESVAALCHFVKSRTREFALTPGADSIKKIFSRISPGDDCAPGGRSIWCSENSQYDSHSSGTFSSGNTPCSTKYRKSDGHTSHAVWYVGSSGIVPRRHDFDGANKIAQVIADDDLVGSLVEPGVVSFHLQQ
jgi:hypothetical protein